MKRVCTFVCPVLLFLAVPTMLFAESVAVSRTFQAGSTTVYCGHGVRPVADTGTGVGDVEGRNSTVGQESSRVRQDQNDSDALGSESASAATNRCANIVEATDDEEE